MNTEKGAENSSSFVDAYLDRLNFPTKATTTATSHLAPTIETLGLIVQSHLSYIPFENLSQHGCDLPASLDVNSIMEKILFRKRGGFCLELNGLLAHLLTLLGYGVRLVPASVYIGNNNNDNDNGYRPKNTHIFLLVTIPQSNSHSTYLVDVGFGEPSVEPLIYELNSQQTTAEGMLSRIVRYHDKSNTLILEWWRSESSSWMPRYRWKIEETDITYRHRHHDTDNVLLFHNKESSEIDELLLPLLPQDPKKNHDLVSGNQCSRYQLTDFEPILTEVHKETSPFSQKFVICKLTSYEKVSISATKMKRTGPPRFSAYNNNGGKSPKNDSTKEKDMVDRNDHAPFFVPSTQITKFNSLDEIRMALRDEFGIPLEESHGLDLNKSPLASDDLWSNFM